MQVQVPPLESKPPDKAFDLELQRFALSEKTFDMYFEIHGDRLTSHAILCKATNMVLHLIGDNGFLPQGAYCAGCDIIQHVNKTTAVCVDVFCYIAWC
jgi:hypothetical protein